MSSGMDDAAVEDYLANMEGDMMDGGDRDVLLDLLAARGGAARTSSDEDEEDEDTPQALRQGRPAADEDESSGEEDGREEDASEEEDEESMDEDDILALLVGREGEEEVSGEEEEGSMSDDEDDGSDDDSIGDEEGSAEEESEDGDGDVGSDEGSREEEEEEEEEEGEEEGEGVPRPLSLQQMYPVGDGRTEDHPPPLGAKPKGQKKKSKSAAKMMMRPGEKKSFRKERIAAKRAERLEGKLGKSGFSLARVCKELEFLFLEREGDMHALPPMKDHERLLVHRAAGCYGLATSSSGSGRKRFVTIRATPRTAMPGGDDLARLKKLLQPPERHAQVVERQLKMLTGRTRMQLEERKGKGVSGDPGELAVDDLHLRADDIAERTGVLKRLAALEGLSSKEARRRERKLRRVQAHIEEHRDKYEKKKRKGKGVRATRRSAKDTPAPRVPLSQRPVDFVARGRILDDMVLDGGGSGSEGEGYEGGESSEAGASLGGERGRKGARGGARGFEGGGLGLGAGGGGGLGLGVGSPGLGAVGGGGEGGGTASGSEGGTPGGGGRKAVDRSFGSFEQHTTGFGSRMLARMGFQGAGSGLGREGSGLAEPIQATKREKKRGLGAEG